MQEARAAVDVYFEMICIKFLPGDPWETGEDECNNNGATSSRWKEEEEDEEEKEEEEGCLFRL